jgi:putative tricarboxylic transport membrane protein
LRRDLVCAALGLSLAAAYWRAADALPASFLSDAVGAGGIPKALASLLAFFSILIGLSALRRDSGAPEIKNHARALVIALLGFAYLLLVPFAGYPASTALLAGAAALHYGAPRRPAVALFGVGTAIVLWLVFGVLLGIALP